MKVFTFILVLAASVAIFLDQPSFGHGGQYRGPGDNQPPDLGGNGGQSSASTSSTNERAGPSGPSGTPSNSGGVRRSGGSGGLARKGGGLGGFDRWEFWWEYNKDIYLNLKNHLYSNDRISGGSSFLTGRPTKDHFRTPRHATMDIIKSSILPTLLESLRIDHPDVQDSSVLAMARVTQHIDAPLVLDHIRKTLASKYKSAQESACLSLGVLGSKEAIPLCRDLMLDTSKGRKLVGESKVPRIVRAFAALSLGLINSGEAVPDLIRVVENENPMTQKDLISCALTALGLLGHTDRKDEIRRFLCGKLLDREMDPFLRSYIPISLGKLGDPAALKEMIRAFNEEKENAWVRQSCAIAIGQLADLGRDEESLDHLIQYIRKGKDVITKHLCFIALAQTGARDDRFNTHQERHKKLSKFFLSEIDKPSRFSHVAWASLAAAIHALPHQDLQTPVIESISRKFRETKNPSHKGAFTISLGLLNAREDAELLYQQLCTSKDKMFQGYLCIGLGLMRWSLAAEKMREFAARETNFFLRLQASVGLGLMGDSKALDVLVKALQEGQTLWIISSAARALGHIGDVTAIKPLNALLCDEKCSNLSKAFAVVALGLIGEKTDLPWNAPISENCNYLAGTEALIEVLDIL